MESTAVNRDKKPGQSRDKRDKRDAAAQPGPGQTGQVSKTCPGCPVEAVSRLTLKTERAAEMENLAPADELAAIRAKLRELQAREAELKGVMLNDPEARAGKDHTVTIKSVTSRRVNADRLRRDYPDVAAVVTDEIAQQQVWVKRHV